MQVGTGVFGQQFMYVILICTFIYNTKNIVKKTWSFQALNVLYSPHEYIEKYNSCNKTSSAGWRQHSKHCKH